jgi:TnsA endonuclease N terminal
MTKFIQDYYTVINKEKYVGAGKPYYRSSWEKTVMRFLDLNENVIKWASEAVRIPYTNPFTNKYSVYIPDFLALYKDKDGKEHSEIIEVKPHAQTMLSESKRQRDKLAMVLNAYKWKAATEYALQHGMKFRVITEHDIYHNPKR